MSTSSHWQAAVCAAVVGAALALWASAAPAQITVTPADERGADGVPDAVLAETPWYKFHFILWETGSADSMIYKPLGHELRAENYYGNHLNMFRDWVRLADPDPIEGCTRNASELETRGQSRRPATYRVVRQDAEGLVLEFEIRGAAAGGQAWMEKIVQRRRLFLRAGSPAIVVENEIVNTDVAERSVLFDVFNGVSLGRVRTCVAMPGPDGQTTGIDIAEERASSFIFAQDLADSWIGGVNQQGLGAGFSFDWPDLDAMQVCMYKTVGSAYHAVMRRRSIPAGGSITLRYTFMPFTGFGTFDGMSGDLAGGILVGRTANYADDVARGELKPGAAVPLKVFLASGSARSCSVRLRCVRREDGQVVLDETRPAALKVAETAVVDASLPIGQEGLYVLTVTVEGAGVRLRMEKPLEVGKTRLAYKAAAPEGEKRGRRDGGIALGPAKMNPQLKTLDPALVTPHLALLTGHARGPVRAFFLTPADSTLGHVREIRERSDIQVEYIAITKISIPRYDLHQGELAEFCQRLRAADPQVLVTFGIDWTIGLRRKLADELLDRVRGGMGLVAAVRDLEKQPELKEAVSQARAVAGPPLSSMAVAGPPIRCYQLDRGRIVLITCDWSHSRDAGRAMLTGWTDLAAGARPVAVQELRWRGFEYGYARLADAIRWAAGLDAPVTAAAATLKDGVVTVTVRNAGEPVSARLSVAARTRRWEVRTDGEAEVTVPAGESRQEVKLRGPLDGGPLALEIHVRDKAGKVLAFASAAASVDTPAAVRVLPDPPYQRAGQPGKCVVEVSGKLAGGRLSVDVIDRFDRLVLSRRQAFRTDKGSARIEAPLDGLSPLCVYHEVVARVYGEAEGAPLLAEGTGEIFILPAEPPYADRFLLGVWGAPERDVLQIQGMLAAARQVGLTLHSHSAHDGLLYATGGFKGALVGLSAKERYAKKGEEVKLDGEGLIMHPPLLPGADAVAAAKAEWQKRARAQFDTGAFILGLDDERRMSDDFDMNPQTLGGFRRWLAARHPTIADLNRAWGANFTDFDQVLPKPRRQLADSPSLAPWLEFRMYIGEVLGEYYMKAAADWAREIDPRLSVCEWGIYEPSAAWPVDWRRYASCYRYTSRYGGTQGVLEDLFRSFAPGTRHGEWQGYGMMAVSPERRIAPWRSLLAGGSFCWFWELRDSGSLNYAVVTSDQRPTAGYAALARDEFPDLTGGIDRLVLACRFTDDRIAVAYSYPSWLCNPSALAGRAKVIVEELGFQHTYVDMDDIAAGRLEKDGYRMLVIQQAECLSRAHLDGLRRFVEQGGVLVCVGRVGSRDTNGAPWADGPLADGVTGVSTARAAPLGRTAAIQIGDKPGSLYVDVKDVTVSGAQVLAEADIDGAKVPVWTVRTLGRGKVFWLNSTLEAHRTVVTGGAAGERSLDQSGPAAVRASHWAVFDRMIAEAGLKPRLRLFDGDRPVFDTETWYYRTPSGRSMLAAHYLAQKVEKPLAVRIQKPAHVYEVRGRKYLGRSDEWTDAFPEGRMKIYALLDYRVTGIEVAVPGGLHAPGETVPVACTVKADGGPDLHAFRLEVRGPDGAALPAYALTVLAPGGTATVRLPLALNQPPGRYKVGVIDVLSGAAADAEFQVAGQ